MNKRRWRSYPWLILVGLFLGGGSVFSDQWDPGDDDTPTYVGVISTTENTHGPHTIDGGNGDRNDRFKFGVSPGDQVQIWSTGGVSPTKLVSGIGYIKPGDTFVTYFAAGQYSDGINFAYDYTVPSGVSEIYLALSVAGSNQYTVHYKKSGSTTPILDYIRISGVTSINEGGSFTYNCWAHYSDGSSKTITPSWSEDSGYATINSSGYLSTSSVSSDQSCTITASYGGKSDTHNVTIKNVAATVASISVTGPDSVLENNSAQYTCTATYSDGSTQNVSSPASWSVDLTQYASISSIGRLTGKSVDSNKRVVVSASYGGKSDTHSLIVRNEVIAPTLSYIEVSGSPIVGEDEQAWYTCTAHYSDGSSTDISSSTSWETDSSNALFPYDNNLLVVSPYLEVNVQGCTITAHYGGKTDTLSIYLEDDIVSISIAGPSVVNENGSAQFICNVQYENGGVLGFTDRANWQSSNTSYAPISSSGLLSAKTVSLDIPVTVTATYQGKTATKSVLIENDLPVTLDSVSISGSSTVNENTTVQYASTAHYSDGSTNDVTSATDWNSSNSSYAPISDSGVLSAKEVSFDLPVTVTASYGGKSATKSITVKNIPASLNSISISGPTSLDENSNAQYHCIAHYSDGSTNDVTTSASWSEDALHVNITNPGGKLIANYVDGNQTCTVTATYDGKTATQVVSIVDIPEVYSLSADYDAVSYPLGNGWVQVEFSGTVLNGSGNPASGIDIAVEDPVARASVAIAATTDAQGRFSYTTDGVNPGTASLFRFVAEGDEALCMVPFEDLHNYQYLGIPNGTITIGQVELDDDLTHRLNFVNFMSDRLDQVMDFGQEVQDAALESLDLLSTVAENEPVLTGASGVALVSCGITALAPNPISGGVCAASVVYLKVAVPVTAIKYVSLDAIGNSSLGVAEQDRLNASVNSGAFIASVMTGSGWFDVAGIAWETYSFKRSIDSGTDADGRVYTEFEAEDPDGKQVVVRMMSAAPPSVPTNPVPVDGATGINRNVVLQWDEADYATGYEVWFGTAPDNMTLVATLSGTQYDTGLRAGNAQFYWKVVATNSAGAAIGNAWSFTTASADTMQEALGAHNIPNIWTPQGSVSWFSQDAVSHGGGSALQSGAVGDNEGSRLDAYVVGPGKLSFWWRTSCEQYDGLQFYSDYKLMETLSGELADWQQYSINIPSGYNRLQWSFHKDNSHSAGQDCGWLDDLTWEPVRTVTYPLSGFDGKWTASFIWDYEDEKWIRLGQKLSPTELVVGDLKNRQWYWLCIMEKNGDDWVFADGRFIRREITLP